MNYRRITGLLALLALALAVFAISGCGWGREGNRGAGCTTSGATLISVGEWTVVAGCAAVGAGILAVVASFFPPTSFLAYFRPVIAEVVALGIAAILLGTSFIWLGTHAWLLALVVLLLCAGLAVRYRVRIARFLGFPRKSQPAKVVGA